MTRTSEKVPSNLNGGSSKTGRATASTDPGAYVERCRQRRSGGAAIRPYGATVKSATAQARGSVSVTSRGP
jgi:hypothetical protein